ncbi:hypothetical protein [Streptomyces sp. Ac-502]|uniref:hypothetical protein n=1 Tax=Streptomyces sp. Ac-502 TaxID=3342801 RepID=UPI003862447A
MAADGVAWVDGARLAPPAGGSPEQARAAALRVVAEMAEPDAPLRVEASEPDGSLWRLLVHSDGRVEDARSARREAEDPAAQAVPEEYQARTRVITAACEAGRYAVAARLAEELRTEAASERGADHPWALQAAELHGYVLMLSGDAPDAAEAYADAARGWAERDRQAYRTAVRHAYRCWLQVADQATAVWVGEQVVEVARLGGEDAAGMLRMALGRLDDLHANLVT